MVKQLVLPIKDSYVLHEVEDFLLNNFKYGRRNATIFKTGMVTLLRVSDVLNLKYDDVYDDHDEVRERAYTKDKKTGKRNTLYLTPLKETLEIYHKWLKDNEIKSVWLFPSMKHPDRAIGRKQFYRIMHKTGDYLSIPYLGTHTMRKTGAYTVYVQTHYNIGLVMALLNHSSERETLRYLGLDQISREKMLDTVNFDV